MWAIFALLDPDQDSESGSTDPIESGSGSATLDEDEPTGYSIPVFRIRGSGLDLNSIRSVDPYPDSQSGSGSRRAKIIHKVEKIQKFQALDVLFGTEGFFCGLAVLSGGLRFGIDHYRYITEYLYGTFSFQVIRKLLIFISLNNAVRYGFLFSKYKHYYHASFL